MFPRQKRWLAAAGVIAAVPLLARCGVSQTDYANLNQQLSVKDQQVTAFQAQLNTQKKQLDDAQAQAAQTAKAPRPILAPIPNAPPPPTAVPSTQTSAPPPAPAVPPPAKTVPLYAHIDTVTAGAGESEYKVDANVSCTKTGQFAPGMRIVWRMEIVDTSSGKILQDADVKAATVKLPTGEEVKFRFGRHGPTEDSPWFWTAGWNVPANFPLGTLDYQVTIDAASGKNVTIGDPLTMSLPDRKMDTRIQIVPLSQTA